MAKPKVNHPTRATSARDMTIEALRLRIDNLKEWIRKVEKAPSAMDQAKTTRLKAELREVCRVLVSRLESSRHFERGPAR